LLYYGIKPESFGQLAVIGRQIHEARTDDARIKVKFVRPYGIVYLDQLMLNASSQRPLLRVSSTYSEVNRYLKQSGFNHLTKHCDLSNEFPTEDIIKIRRFNGTPLQVEDQVVTWLKENVFGFLPALSKKLSKRIVENLWEIVHNGILHGKSSNGVSAAGQFYPQMGYFEVAFCDNGLGIVNTVRNHGVVTSSEPDSECIKWAIQKGNSTMPAGTSAGLGLHLLREFLRVNCGSIQIVSGEGYFGQFGEESPSYLTLRNSIAGTLVNLRVVFDNNLYQMKGEDK